MATKNPLVATVLAAIVFAVTIAASTPSAEARRKPPVDPEAVVAKFLDKLDEDLDELHDIGNVENEQFDSLVDDLDAAVEDGKLKRVLATEARLHKYVSKEFRSYEKYLDWSLNKALKTLDKADADPAFATQLEAEVAAARNELQTWYDQIRQKIAIAVDVAIAQIEDDLDDDIDDADDNSSGDDSPSGDDDGTPDQGSGDA